MQVKLRNNHHFIFSLLHVTSGRLNASSDDEEDMTSGDEGRDKPLVEFVHSLQVHVAGLPHILINQIKSRMSDELVQMSVIILSRRV